MNIGTGTGNIWTEWLLLNLSMAIHLLFLPGELWLSQFWVLVHVKYDLQCEKNPFWFFLFSCFHSNKKISATCHFKCAPKSYFFNHMKMYVEAIWKLILFWKSCYNRLNVCEKMFEECVILIKKQKDTYIIIIVCYFCKRQCPNSFLLNFVAYQISIWNCLGEQKLDWYILIFLCFDLTAHI